MAKDWVTSKELTEIAGLPSTIQGINRKARVEGWKSRKRSGIQGKAVEYYVDSLPEEVQQHLRNLHTKESPGNYSISDVEPIQVWISSFNLLKNNEKEMIKNWLMRNGLKELVKFISQQIHDDENNY